MPGPISPVTPPSTLTRASETRCTTALIALLPSGAQAILVGTGQGGKPKGREGAKKKT